jgi:hypothetical protein
MTTHSYFSSRRKMGVVCATAVFAIAGCTLPRQPDEKLPTETIHAVTASNQLISFSAGQPGRILSRKSLQGMQANEALIGIDYRVARGQLYGLSNRGQLYRIDTERAVLEAVGVPNNMTPAGSDIGFDFNPTVDRIRVVTPSGQNMRLHPDTGAVVDADPNTAGVQTDGKLTYAAGDAAAGQAPSLVAAGYTYNKTDEKITTNFAIDNVQRTLVTQGTREGKLPAVSPNTGQLFTVGALGIDAFAQAAFDIADINNAAFLATTKAGAKTSSWYQVNLGTGKATLLGEIGAGEPVIGIAIAP